MLPESRLFTFIDNNEGYVLHFLEGQKLIHDLVLIHDFQNTAFTWFRDSVLSSQLMISLLKKGEGFGFYLDSEDPYFRLKLETGFDGQMRSLIIPESFEGDPEKISGICRLTKTFQDPSMQPYTSVIELQQTSLTDIINGVLRQSFQLESEVFVSSYSDQSIMISRLPDEEDADDYTAVREYRLRFSSLYNSIFSKGLTDEGEVVRSFEELGYRFLASRKVFFQCVCSRERMLHSLQGIFKSGQMEFKKDEKIIETRCDYCKQMYQLKREEVEIG